MTRCLQLFDLLPIRTGVLLLGLAGVGKSATWRLLAAALSALDTAAGGRAATVHRVFPKVRPRHMGSWHLCHWRVGARKD